MAKLTVINVLNNTTPYEYSESKQYYLQQDYSKLIIQQLLKSNDHLLTQLSLPSSSESAPSDSAPSNSAPSNSAPSESTLSESTESSTTKFGRVNLKNHYSSLLNSSTSYTETLENLLNHLASQSLFPFLIALDSAQALLYDFRIPFTP